MKKLSINEQEKNIILEQHKKAILSNKIRSIISEQETQIPIRNSDIAQKLIDDKLCFCKTAFTCDKVQIIGNKTFVLARARFPKTQDTTTVFNTGDLVYFDVFAKKYHVKSPSAPAYSWSCGELNTLITNAKNAIVANLEKYNYLTQDKAGVTRDNQDFYEVYSVKQIYPFLFGAYDEDLLLYRPKGAKAQTQLASSGLTKEQQNVIDSAKKKYMQLQTMEEVLEREGVTSFNEVANLYVPYQIGSPGDGIFNRVFNLYYRQSGQTQAKQMSASTKAGLESIEINQNTCKKLIKDLYEMYKTDSVPVAASQFETLKKQVTYCSRKYKSFGLLGSGNVDAMVSELKGLPNSNKFNID
jgi:hypothetical protein